MDTLTVVPELLTREKVLSFADYLIRSLNDTHHTASQGVINDIQSALEALKSSLSSERFKQFESKLAEFQTNLYRTIATVAEIRRELEADPAPELVYYGNRLNKKANDWDLYSKAPNSRINLANFHSGVQRLHADMNNIRALLE